MCLGFRPQVVFHLTYFMRKPFHPFPSIFFAYEPCYTLNPIHGDPLYRAAVCIVDIVHSSMETKKKNKKKWPFRHLEKKRKRKKKKNDEVEKRRIGLTKKKKTKKEIRKKKCCYYLYYNYIIIILGG